MTETPKPTIETPDDVDLMDAEIQDCPFQAYGVLREQAPVYRDPNTGFHVISRYDDIRAILMNPKVFSSKAYGSLQAKASNNKDRIQQIFAERGWRPARTVGTLDDPEHKELRAIYERALRPARVKELDKYVREIAYRTVDSFAAAGHCEIVEQFAIPIPLLTVGKILDAREEDLDQIRRAATYFGRRISHMATEEEELECVEQELKVQHYFHPIIDELRRNPNASVLSDLVNTEIEAWGRRLNDEELHSEIIADFFFGGSDTTRNALAEGVQFLIEQRGLWERLKADREGSLKKFIEEVLRLVSPAQASPRITTEDVELHGVQIPKGSVISLRLGAANRDDRKFECPNHVMLERRGAGAHLAFGSGIHHCVGAPLARRELWWGFSALLDGVENLRFAQGKNDFRHHPHYLMRSLVKLHVEFDQAGD